MASKAATTTREPIGRIGMRRQVVIPRPIFEQLNMREGDFVAFTKQADGVLVKLKRLVDPDEVLTPAEAKQVRHAMKQMKEGRFKLWRDVKVELDR